MGKKLVLKGNEEVKVVSSGGKETEVRRVDWGGRRPPDEQNEGTIESVDPKARKLWVMVNENKVEMHNPQLAMGATQLYEKQIQVLDQLTRSLFKSREEFAAEARKRLNNDLTVWHPDKDNGENPNAAWKRPQPLDANGNQPPEPTEVRVGRFPLFVDTLYERLRSLLNRLASW